MTIGYYGGSGVYGIDPYGSVPPLIGVQSATAIDGTHVEVFFNAFLDGSFSPILSPSNYLLSPSLTVLSVEQTSVNSVILTTTAQASTLYTVTVLQARSTFGTLLDPLQNSATFTGIGGTVGFFAIATAATRVRVVFSTTMLNDGNLSNHSNYTITDFSGNAVTIASATPEQASNPISVILALSSALTETGFYVCTVSSNIHTVGGLNVLPPTSVFQWVAASKQLTIPLGLFSGEVTGGFFGNPAGLVYFSPALNVSTANSIIQVEDIDVCTTAYDTYTLPAPIDPTPLFTYGGGLVPTPSPDPYLLNQCVLWAPFPRNFEAQINLGFTGAANQDIVPTPVDTSCSIIIQQQFALGYVALLNDTAFYLLPKNSHLQSVPPMFITAKNTSPIPAGPETIMVLHVALGGTSNFGPAAAKKVAHSASSMAGNSQLFAGAGPPPVVLAQATLAAGATMTALGKEAYGGRASIAGIATVNALATGGFPPPTVIFASSSLVAFAGVRRAVAAASSASSSVSATAKVRRGVAASLVGAGAVTATAKAKWAAHASVAGSSSVTANATVTHKAESFPQGAATVTATHT